MKKFIALLLAATMLLTLTACGKKNEEQENAVQITDSLELLTTVWNSYADSDKFPTMGGDFDENNSTMDAPGKFGVEDAGMLDNQLALPADAAEKIDDAASLTHMMNANTFTCGAFRVVNSDDVAGVAEAIKNNIQQRLWMCGFPDKLVVITIGNYVVSAFGNEELINTFKTQTTTAYESAVVAYEEAIA